MATPTLATVGGLEFAVGYAGQISHLPGGLQEIETRTNENAVAIAFGAPACRGAVVAPGVNGNVQPAYAGGVVLGFAVRALSEANTAVAAGTVNYPQFADVPIMREGLMWVVAAETAVEGDAAVAVVATPTTVGSTTGGAVGAGRLATGAVWRQSVAAGAIGLISIKNVA